MGIVQLRELINTKYYDFYEPVSRRGYPHTAGPMPAVYETMAQENVIFHAKCDITDPMQYEDLMNYVPPYQAMMHVEDPAVLPWIASVRADMGSMTTAMDVEKAIFKVEESGVGVEKALKEAKRKVGNPSYKDDQESINEVVAKLEEEDTQITELLADLTAKLNTLK